MKIIVSGDDFGKSEDVNREIENCHRNGILTSASLVPNGKSFDGAIRIIKRNIGLGVGVHLSIDDFDNIFKGPSSCINPLTNKFYYGKDVLKRIKSFKYKHDDLIKEYNLQVEKVLDYGVSITHLDHHHHLHLYLPIANAVLQVAKKYEIPFIRTQRILLHNNRGLIKLFYRLAHQIYLKCRHNTTDGYLDLIYTTFDDMFYRLKKLTMMRYNVVEIITHPCKEKKHEVSFLTNSKVIELARSLELVHYGELTSYPKRMKLMSI